MNKYADTTMFAVNPTIFSPKVVGGNIYGIYFIITKVVFSKAEYVGKVRRPEHK
jgi:hypothetical protein